MSSDGDAVPSDALLTALSRAAALSSYRLMPWPPAEVATLGREKVAGELRIYRNLDSGYELAQVALHELPGDADAELRGELAAAAVRRPWPTRTLDEPGTVGAALQARALDGLCVEDDRGGSLRVDWFAPHFSLSRARMLLALTWVRDGEVRRAWQSVVAPSDLALARRLAPDWREQATAALGEALAQLGAPEWSAGDVGEHLLQSLLPSALGGRAAWLLTRGVELLRAGPDGSIAEVQADRQSHALYLLAASHEAQAASYGRVRLLARVVTFAGEALRDIRESEGWDFPLLAEDHDAPPPDDETDVRAAVAAWRVAMADYWGRVLERDTDTLPGDLLAESRPLSLLSTWLRGGPPGPAPAAPPPAVVIAEDRLAAAAARVRGVVGEELESLRAEVDDQVVAALELGGWTVLFCPCHRPPPGTFQEDRIVLVDPDDAGVTILMSDPWNGHVMPIDGDAALFRAVATFWRELIVRAGLDVEFILPRLIEDEDEDDEDEEDDDTERNDGRTTLLEWLEFPLPSRGTPRFPAIDWRIHGDGEEGDFIAEFSFWADGPFAMPPETRAEYEAAIASHWHEYIRAVVDPAFPRKA